jgi:hypothetical protein
MSSKTRHKVLRIRRGGRLLGSWSLAEGDIEVAVIDVDTGEELTCLTVQRGAAPRPMVSESLPTLPQSSVGEDEPLVRFEGDDLTMPLPEGLASHPFDDPLPTLMGRQVLDGGMLMAPGRMSDDDLTMPFPELDHTSDLPELTLEPDDLLVGNAPVNRQLQQARVLEAMKRPPTGASPPPAGDPMREAASAEVWVRRRGIWEVAGRLRPGQSIKSMGGSVRLEDDGGLSVASGTQMAGTATLLDGETIPVPDSEEAVRLPPGTSVLLRSPKHGIYVRSELAADEDDQVRVTDRPF